MERRSCSSASIHPMTRGSGWHEQNGIFREQWRSGPAAGLPNYLLPWVRRLTLTRDCSAAIVENASEGAQLRPNDVRRRDGLRPSGPASVEASPCGAKPFRFTAVSIAIPRPKRSRRRSTRPSPTVRQRRPWRGAVQSRSQGFRYSRIANPTTEILENRVARSKAARRAVRRLRPGGARLRLPDARRSRRLDRRAAAALRHDAYAARPHACATTASGALRRERRAPRTSRR